MNQNKLSISQEIENENDVAKNSKTKLAPRDEAQAKFERRWLKDSDQFNTQRNAVERERIDRIERLINKNFNPLNKTIVDLGCGDGVLAERLAAAGATVQAVDIAQNCLKRLEKKARPGIFLSQEFVPRTLLSDYQYDLVIAADLIADLSPQYFRLFFSELARLGKKEGKVVCSTAVDFDSDDSLEKFVTLAETEFTVEDHLFSYHRLYIKLMEFLKRPSWYVTLAKDLELQNEELTKLKTPFSKRWFRWMISPLMRIIFQTLNWMLTPFIHYIEQSKRILLWFEKVTKFIWDNEGISHVILICQQKPLVVPATTTEKPAERKGRKQIWE